MLAEIGVDGSQIFGGFRGPAQLHLAANHLIEARVHLLLLDKVSSVCLGETTLNRFTEATVAIE